MERFFYCYQIVFGDEGARKTYIGQATSRTRVLTHLAASHNAKVREEMARARKWPSLRAFRLSHPCLGDLTLMEDALIAFANYHSGCEDRPRKYADLLNGTRGRDMVVWKRVVPEPDSDVDGPEDSRTAILLDGVSNGGTQEMWQLRGWPPCSTETIEDIRRAADAIRDPDDRGTSVDILPAAGTDINRISLSGLRDRLEGRGTVLVVFISSQALEDGRDAVGPGTTPEQRRDRCIRYWPVTKDVQRQLKAAPPDTIVAVTGAPSFRLVLGAWRVVPDPACLYTGDWQPDGDAAEIDGIAGLVLDQEVRFGEATYPVYVLDKDGGSILSRGSKIWSDDPNA